MFLRRVEMRLLTPFIGVLALLFATATSGFADQRDFTLINNSSADIHHVYVSPSTSNSWGATDILGENVLLPGYQVGVNFEDRGTTCVWDIKTVAHNGTEGYLYNVDLCSVSDVYTTSFHD